MNKNKSPGNPSRITKLVLHESCFLQNQTGRLVVAVEGQDDKHLQPFEMIILQPGECQLEYLDNTCGAKVWPRSATKVKAIRRVDPRHSGMIIQIPNTV